MSALPLFREQGAESSTLRCDPEVRLTKEATAPRSLLPAPVVRPATLADVPGLEALIAPFVASGDLLPRSNYDLCRHIKEYLVVEGPGGGGGEAVVGCGALKIYSRELAEVAGLAVRDDHQGVGIGRALVQALLVEGRRLGVSEVFALTRKPVFFFRLGFEPAVREHFPLKVWADCDRCPRQASCDEVAVALRLPVAL